MLAGPVADLAVAGDALVGIDPDQRAAIGARPTTATRRSVILKSEGLELRWTFCVSAGHLLFNGGPTMPARVRPASPPRPLEKGTTRSGTSVPMSS